MATIAKSPSPLLPDVSMSQSSLIVAALIGGFVIWLTINGKLANYWAILTGGASATASATPAASTSSSTSSASPATPTTSTPTTTAPATTTTTPPAAIVPSYANPSSYVGAIEAGFGGTA